MDYDVVVIGGGPSALSFIKTLRELYPEKKVLVIRKSRRAIIPCAIPYIIGGLKGIDNIVVDDGIYSQLSVELVVDEVIDVDRSRKIVKTRDGHEIRYKKLVIATGTSPIRIPIDGIDLKNVVFVSKEYDALKEAYDVLSKSKEIVIIGAGFVGLEFADDLADNRKISVVEILDEALPLSFDNEFGILARTELERKGVRFYLGRSVSKIVGSGRVEKVILSDGTELKADAVLISIGVKPNSELAVKMGLAVDDYGHIIVDDYMRTTDPDILAVGDVAQRKDFMFNKSTKAYFAHLAIRDGFIAAMNIFSPGRTYKNVEVLPVFATKIGNITLASAGIIEKVANSVGMEIIPVIFEVENRHPPKLPDAKKMLFKAIFEKTTLRLIGAQIAGPESVVEIMNSIAHVIQLELTAYQIINLQYATHPLVTSSPSNHPLRRAAYEAIMLKDKSCREI
ncbi:MAG: FAD-dependent oxidoreductase [Crenarchaeota archaeon]|nr:FAD-dependent oxidoreductase [Thermoproteota archaeon]